MIIWLTGLSGAGKSTLAKALAAELKSRRVPVVLLDGDEMRWVVQDASTGHDWESRLRNAYRICRMAKLLENQGLIVIVATMSLFHEIHAWNRREFESYLEVLVQTDMDVIRKRDARGLYKRFESGEAANVAGLDLQAELPENPDLILQNDQDRDDYTSMIQQILERAGLTVCLQSQQTS